MSGRKPNPPIYVLPHGIEVVGEYEPNEHNRYWRVRIRPHRFFPDVVERNGGIYVRRSRVILASRLGRPLTPQEHAHHDDEDRDNDTPGNIELLSPTAHNQHHKTGAKHSIETKRRISEGLKRAISEGRRDRPTPPDFTGQKHGDSTKEKISQARQAYWKNKKGLTI